MCEQTTEDETTPSWLVAIVLIASVFVVFLVLFGCFALLWFVYKKTKYTFLPRNSLPQHLKEFLGHPHHSTLLFFSFPLSDESEVFDKLSVITENSENSMQDSGDSCSLKAPSGPGPPELLSKEETHLPGHSDSTLPMPASDSDRHGHLTKHQIYNSQTLDLSEQPKN